MKLTKKQEEALPILEWLFDNKLFSNRATGRTRIILYVLIKKAIENPNSNIPIIDHFPMSAQSFNHIVIPQIINLLEDSDFIKYKNYIRINKTYRTLSYRPMERK